MHTEQTNKVIIISHAISDDCVTHLFLVDLPALLNILNMRFKTLLGNADWSVPFTPLQIDSTITGRLKWSHCAGNYDLKIKCGL